MTNSTRPSLKLLAAASALLAFGAAQAALLPKADYKAGKTRISADDKADKSACNAQTANAKDICIQQAKAKEKVGLAGDARSACVSAAKSRFGKS